MISVKCPGCSTESHLKDKYAGKVGKCKKCGETLRIPTVTKKEAANNRGRALDEVFKLPSQPQPARVESGWWVKVGRKTYGPYTDDQLKDHGVTGHISCQSLIAKERNGPFFLAGRMRDFFPMIQEKAVVDYKGAWCPHCKSRNSEKRMEDFGCFWVIIILVSLGWGLLLFPFFPRSWHCLECGNTWRA